MLVQTWFSKYKQVKDSERKSEGKSFVVTAAEGNSMWLGDSAASEHLTTNKSYFVEYEPFQVPYSFGIGAKGSSVFAYGKGKIQAEVFINGKWKPQTVSDVYYTP